MAAHPSVRNRTSFASVRRGQVTGYGEGAVGVWRTGREKCRLTINFKCHAEHSEASLPRRNQTLRSHETLPQGDNPLRNDLWWKSLSFSTLMAHSQIFPNVVAT